MRTSYYTKLTGTSFRQKELAKVKPGVTKLRCVPRPDNEYDEFAVEVQALLDEGWVQIGWIKKGTNALLQRELINGNLVDIECTQITGENKDTLGCNVSIAYGEDDSVDLTKLEKQEVIFGDSKYIYFDEYNHRAYDEDGHLLVSGSQVEHQFAPEVNLEYPAKALSKSCGVKKEDIILCWDHNRDLAADFGTVVHKALQYYYQTKDVLEKIDSNREREHTAKNWMPEYLGSVVDSFVKTSQLQSALTEVRVKHGTLTGIIDNLVVEGNEFTIYDYKVTKEIKDIKYKKFGSKKKYTVQQNVYRHILESLGMKCKGMYLWQWDNHKWTKHELERIDIKGEVDNE